MKTRKDLVRVDVMLRLTPTKPRLKKQKGAIEKIIFLAQAEIAKLRKRARPPKAPTR
jgi:ERCC4-related helicase